MTIDSFFLYELEKLYNQKFEKRYDKIRFQTSFFLFDDEFFAKKLYELYIFIDQKLFFYLNDFVDICFKMKFDELFFYRSNDYQIEIQNFMTFARLNFVPIYTISTKHFQLLKDFIYDNLQKRFIWFLKISFVSSIIYQKKPNDN